MADILKSTEQKIAAVLEKIDAVAELKFPHHGPRDALDHIKGVFSVHLDEVRRHRNASPSVQHTFCRRAIEDIGAYLHIVGFIARAADLDGPVELHGPLLDLTERALKNHSKLVMASEWDYSPFTILFPALSNAGYVLVGLPGSEASNALLAPLAGHELGHNIWAVENLDRALQEETKDAIVKTIVEKQPTFIVPEIRTDPARLRDLDGHLQWYQCWQWLRRQCEEAFCDMIGLLIFRESFLHAFAYFLTPTLTDSRSYEYPSIRNRAQCLVDASNREHLKIKVPANYVETFSGEEIDKEDEERVAIADGAFLRMIGTLYDRAKDVAQQRELVQSSEEEIARIEKRFRLVVPATDTKSLSDIVNAGWRVHLEPGNFLVDAYPRANPNDAGLILNELVLKSIEVFEIERRSSAA